MPVIMSGLVTVTGHEAEIAHTGSRSGPFAPEVDLCYRRWHALCGGWSLDLAENVFAVAGAIQHGIRHHGKPFLYYSDNGSGETADILDKEVWGDTAAATGD